MPKPDSTDIRLSIDVPRSIWAKIASLAVIEGREKKAIVADALEMYIAKKEGK
jgi:hypothetical protein